MVAAMDKDFNKKIGSRIRKIREKMGMTREEFSILTDLSESFLAAVENGTKGISAQTVYKICDSVNVTSDYLIFGKENGLELTLLINGLLGCLDVASREGAYNILREYVKVFQKEKKDASDVS